jgi:hypothetical protein
MDAWGTMSGGFCFEGSLCLWTVRGGGRVTVIRGALSGRVERMYTDAPRWRTRRSVGRGTGVAALRRRYGSRLRRANPCGLNGFGGSSPGYALSRRGARGFTLFETNRRRTRVIGVWIGRGRLPAASRGC